jgi:hypothetical protein
MDNLDLWNKVRTPDPAATKAFSRTGGFKGTATNAVYLIQKATELWGPMGGAWGVDIVEDRTIQGAPIILEGGQVVGHELLHVIRINLKHPGGVVPGYGQTMLVGKNKYGPFTDEEAPKKSLTDALTKALSWLGFAADIHMGLWDDSKYVNDVKEKYVQDSKKHKQVHISDDRFKAALEKIVTGQYTTVKLRENFLLTDEQEAQLVERIANA